MVKSLMFSMIAQLSRKDDGESFAQRYPGAWLTWEPGSWMPAKSATHLLTMQELKAKANVPAAGEGLAFYLDPSNKRVFLGRESDCDIVINDGTLSHRHVMLAREQADRWNLSDLGSTNGTWVDGEKLPRAFAVTLRSEAKIKAGSVLLGFYTTRDLQRRLLAPQTPA